MYVVTVVEKAMSILDFFALGLSNSLISTVLIKVSVQGREQPSQMILYDNCIVLMTIYNLLCT